MSYENVVRKPPPLPGSTNQERKWREWLSQTAARIAGRIDLRLPTPVIYMGSKTEEGSWRFITSGATLLVQKLESGAWKTYHTYGPL